MKKIFFLFGLLLLIVTSISAQPPVFNGQDTKTNIVIMDQYGFLTVNHKKFFGTKEEFLFLCSGATVKVKQPIQYNLMNLVAKDIHTKDTSFRNIELVSTFKMKHNGAWRIVNHSTVMLPKSVFAETSVANKKPLQMQTSPEDIVKNQ